MEAVDSGTEELACSPRGFDVRRNSSSDCGHRQMPCRVLEQIPWTHFREIRAQVSLKLSVDVTIRQPSSQEQKRQHTFQMEYRFSKRDHWKDLGWAAHEEIQMSDS